MGGFVGPVFRPGDVGYDAERTGFNISLDHRPALVVGATGADDVAAAIGRAVADGCAVGMMASGHGPAASADGHVLVNTRRMDGVVVDPVARTARVGAGVRWWQALPEITRHGLAPLNGASPDVGVVGYTLGGGVGPLGRAYGYAADRVRALDVVTADGQLRHASPTTEPDLFWALRGGKGNFGVVVAIEFDLVPVAELYGGSLSFVGEAGVDALHAYCDWAADLPGELTSSVLMIRFPDIPVLPPPLRGQFVTNVRIAYCGAMDEGERLVRPLRSLGTAVLDTVARMPYVDVGTIYNDPSDPTPAYDSNVVLSGLDHAAVDALVAAAGPSANAPLLVELRHLGGAYARRGDVPSAVGQRDAAFDLFSASVLGRDGELDVVRGAHRRLFDALRPWSTGGSLLNLLGIDDATPERVRTAYDPTDYTRLAQLKARYDPDNLFRLGFTIPPAGS